MDEPDEVLPLRLVVMLSVPNRELQAEVVGALVRAFADAQFAARLLEVSSEEATQVLDATFS